MAREAFPAKIVCALGLQRQGVWVMASSTPETIATGLLTPALPEFLKMADHFHRLDFRRGPDKWDRVIRQKISRAKCSQRPSRLPNVDLTHQVASSADAVAAKGVETNGVDNVS